VVVRVGLDKAAAEALVKQLTSVGATAKAELAGN